MQAPHKEHLYKLLVIGDLGVGKTSIIKRYVHQNFSSHYRATIGVDFALKVLHWDPETVVRLQLWDIAGERSEQREQNGGIGEAESDFLALSSPGTLQCDQAGDPITSVVHSRKLGLVAWKPISKKRKCVHSFFPRCFCWILPEL